MEMCELSFVREPHREDGEGREEEQDRRGGGKGQEGEEGEKGLLSEPLIIIFQIRPNSHAGCQGPPPQVASPAQSPAVLPTTI